MPPKTEAIDKEASQPAEAIVVDSETRLDALLTQTVKAAKTEAAVQPVKVDPLDRVRELFATTLQRVIEELRTKYGPSGIGVRMDAEKFLAGGRSISITIEFDGQGSRLDGTIMNSTIAFQQTRYHLNERSGLTGSGPTLRTRDLSAESFRAFLCERIATLVRSVVKQPVGKQSS